VIDPPDPGKQIAELGAIPAWQAVVDRTLYLARRGQKGVGLRRARRAGRRRGRAARLGKFRQCR